MTQFAVSALVERRREIMREKAYLEREIVRCDEAMGHLDATIHLLDAGYDLAKVTAKQYANEDEFFQPGETPILALEVLREAGRPLATPAITTAILKRRGLFDLVGKAQFQRLNAKVNAALNAKFRQRLVRKTGGVPGETRSIIWELVGRGSGGRFPPPASANSLSTAAIPGE